MDELEKLLRNARHGKRFLYPAMLLSECGYTQTCIDTIHGDYRFTKEETKDSIIIHGGLVAFMTASPTGTGIIRRNPTREEVVAVAHFLSTEQEE